MISLLMDVALTVLIVRIALMVLMLVSAVYLVIIVMQQKDNSEGLGVLGGQSSENESFYGKNTAKSKEHIQKVLTVVAAVVLAVCAVVFYII